MDTQRYVTFRRGSKKKLRRRVIAAGAALLVILAGAFVIGKLTEDSPEYRLKVSLVEENRILREQVDELTAYVNELQRTVSNQEQYIAALPTEPPKSNTEGGAEAETPAPGTGFTAGTPRTN